MASIQPGTPQRKHAIKGSIALGAAVAMHSWPSLRQGLSRGHNHQRRRLPVPLARPVCCCCSLGAVETFLDLAAPLARATSGKPALNSAHAAASLACSARTASACSAATGRGC